MRITSETGFINAQGLAEMREIVCIKAFSELASGDKFKALIKDIMPNGVTLLFDDGLTITARSLALPDARIGDEAVFRVKDIVKGQILIEMVRPDSGNPRVSLIREALLAAGQPLTAENIELVGALIENGLPIDSETFYKAAFFKFAENLKLDIDKVIFLIKESFPAEPKTVQTLSAFLEGKMNLSADAARLPEVISSADDSVLKNLAQIFEKPEFTKLFGREIIETIIPVLKSGSKPEIVKSFTDMIKSIIKDVHELQAEKFEPDAVYGKILKLARAVEEAFSPQGRECPEARRIIDNLEFCGNISNYKEYLQIPFFSEGQSVCGELHVFRKSKKEKIKDGASMLLSLDMSTIGHLDTLIDINGKSLGIQFRPDNDNAVRLISRQGPALCAVLSQKGYSVSHFNVRKSAERFDITATGEEKPENREEPRRYSFDMRV